MSEDRPAKTETPPGTPSGGKSAPAAVAGLSREVDAFDPPNEHFTRRMTRRLLSLEKKVADLKPIWWKTLAMEVSRLLITAAVTLGAVWLTGHYSLNNLRANTRETVMIADVREVTAALNVAESAFQSFLGDAAASDAMPAAGEFAAADSALRNKVVSALIPKSIRAKVETARLEGENAKKQLVASLPVNDRKEKARKAIPAVENAFAAARDAIEAWVETPDR